VDPVAFASAQRAAVLASRAAAACKTQREVFVGGLTAGVTTQEVLRGFFDAALAALSPTGPPVLAVQLSADAKYAFVELRDEALANAALTLHGTQVAGRPLSIARPSGYVHPSAVAALQAAAAAELQAGPPAGGAPSQAALPALGDSAVLRLDNVATAAELADPGELHALLEDLRGEAQRFGALAELFVSPQSDAPAHPVVYLRFAEAPAAALAQATMQGRLFDGRVVAARLVLPHELQAAQAKEAEGPQETAS